jgi:hypothetical protein
MQVRRWRNVITPPLAGALVAVLLLSSPAAAQPVLPPIAPPKPIAPRAANAIVISTGDLNEAVNWARQGNLANATDAFNLFRDDWNATADDVSAQSDEIAQMVIQAIDSVRDVLDDSPPPAQAKYFPAFQNLASVIEDANAQLGQIAPATAALRINPTDLGQSVAWASQGNLARAHDEFSQFQDDWSLVRDAVRQQAPTLADAVEAASANVSSIINDPANPAPTQTAYFPALQSLQQAVLDANAQLAQLGAPAAGNAAPGSGPIKIRSGNLDESVDWAGQENLDRARSEFGQFKDDWAGVQAAVRRQQADVADQVENAIDQVDTILAASNPPKTDYFPALQNLQSVVDDANKQLGN